MSSYRFGLRCFRLGISFVVVGDLDGISEGFSDDSTIMCSDGEPNSETSQYQSKLVEQRRPT